MIDLSKLEIGTKVKTELRAISCATGEENVQVEWKHWWEVAELDEDKIKLQDSKGEVMFFDRSGRGFMPYTNHFIYKIK